MPQKVGSPSNWDDAVRAAKLRYLGHTQGEVAKVVGKARSTIACWEMSDWWPKALEEAEADGLDEIVEKARRVVLDKLEESNAATAKWVLERRDKMFTKKNSPDDSESKDLGPNLSRFSDDQLDALVEFAEDRLSDESDE